MTLTKRTRQVYRSDNFNVKAIALIQKYSKLIQANDLEEYLASVIPYLRFDAHESQSKLVSTTSKGSMYRYVPPNRPKQLPKDFCFIFVAKTSSVGREYIRIVDVREL